MSALAQYYLAKSHEISGSDLAASEITDFLKKQGARIFLGPHSSKNVSKDIDLVIYSPAVTQENPEFKEAKKLKIKCQSYPQALGELTKTHYTIAITGTHGKSTTTCMLGLLLQKAGLDPTVIVGTKLKEFGDSNYRGGKSKYLIIEACEHFESFLDYWPKIIILTSVEADHLDYYKNLKNVLRGFRRFILHLPEDGVLVANGDDENIQKIIRGRTSQGGSTSLYSIKQKEAKKLKQILRVPGEHNVYNALSALTVARILKVPDKISFKALSEYRGAWRRFEIRQLAIGDRRFAVVSDYAHHPTEIKATLRAAREKYLYPPKFSGRKLRRARKKIWCVYQPHQYQRTFYLLDEFVKVFSEAIKFDWIEKLILIDIYNVAGREEKKIKERVSSEKLAKKIKTKLKGMTCKKVLYIPTKEKSKDYLKKNLRGGEIIIIMGAGDIYKLISFFVDE